MMIAKLLDLDEMKRRHKKGEDPFDLAIEKWVRIRDFLQERKDAGRYRKAFQCGVTKVLFCLDYQDRCNFCPLENICTDNQSLYYQVMQQLQVYSLAGSLLSGEPLIHLIESYIEDLQHRRTEWLKKSH
jgi:hypothetical protein